MARSRSTPGGRASVLRRPGAAVALVLLLILGLDFLGWLTNTRSLVFSLILGERTAASRAESVARMLGEELAAQRIASPVRRFIDEAGTLHLSVALPRGRYLKLEAALKKRLAADGAVLSRVQEESDRSGVHLLWEVRSSEGGAARLLFSSPEAGTAPAVKAAPPEAGPGRPAQAAIIMDDLGYSLEAARSACALGLPLTLSILPFSPQAVATAQVGHEHGLEIILHLPMESREGHDTEKHTAGLIEARMPDEEIRLKVREQAYAVPYIRGANNHMGSLLTESAEKMTVVLSVLRETGLYFVDSRTSPASRALGEARRLGLPAAGSDLFLDAAGDAAALGKNLRSLLRLARRRGWALGIVHPYPETLEALKECAALFEKQGVELVPASVVVARASKT
jgi:hypothetical protein